MNWTLIDSKYAITQADKDEVLGRYFAPDNQLVIKNFPAKEKRKVIILQKIMTDFEQNAQYSEKDVNAILQRYYDDYALVRRCLIGYGWIERSDDGAVYRVKKLTAS